MRLREQDEFYTFDYARLLKGEGVNSNYLVAVADRRIQQLKDIEHMQALLKIKKAYDKKHLLVQKFGKNWRRHVPKGYKVFSPLSGHFILSAHTLTKNVLGVSLEVAGQNLGLSDETMKILRAKVTDNSGEHMLVLPAALADTRENSSAKDQRAV